MKLKFYLRYSLVIIVFLLITIPSCKVIKDVSVKESGYLLENVTDQEKYFLKIDTVYDRTIEGRSYKFDDELIVNPEPFKVDFEKWSKSKVVLSDTMEVSYKVKKRKSDILRGWFSFEGAGEKKQFVLTPCDFDDYQYFKRRYKDEIFEVERIADVAYASAKGFWSSMPDDTIDVTHIVKMGLLNSLKKKDLTLDMDIYIPKDDTISKRPLVMLIHGGAFFIGDKATLAYQKWCAHFASLGYVCVSINYRMGFRMSSKAIERTAYQATQDAHAAMRYLVSKKDVYRIDTDYLFVGGASAGSITALNLAYMRNENRPKSSYSSLLLEDLGDLETSGNKIYNKFRIRAVANMWGAVNDLKMLENANIPIVSFHGDKDEVLPYGVGYPFMAIGDFQRVLFDEMYGSACIHEKARELGIRSELYTFYGEGHTLHLDGNRNLNANFYTIQNRIGDFFYQEMLPRPVRIVQDRIDLQMFEIDTADIVTTDWYVVGGVSVEESKGKIRALWFDDEAIQELRVSGCYRNGTGFEDVFVIKNIVENENNTY